MQLIVKARWSFDAAIVGTEIKHSAASGRC